MIVELNGAPLSESRIQGLALYNYGHFTTFVADRGRVKGLDLHLDRLDRDSEAMHGTGLDRGGVRELIAGAVGRIEGRAVLRVTVFDPDLDLGRPAAVLAPQVLITARAAPSGTPGPVSLGVAEYRRDLPQVKHTGLMRTVALRRRAQRAGFDDVAFCDDRRRLSEGATWNLAFIDHAGTLVLPDRPCLEGVTLRLLTREAEAAGVPCLRRTVTVADARSFPAGMITNAAVGSRPMRAFDGAPLDPEHPVLTALRRRYERIPGEAV
ncbi:MAG TPA: aminotransferase class IV [Glycomyces sp.]|nr:aminotransferase class IV [Glycomyces sp.]